ncbi:class I SAM-dependent methyltransferase [Metallosphaera tengchongensis]|uniref:Class I SAM-dependent methyltransferase n=1 Tax=Metallosphaera tengchongensis TaxID=1532350 RepID=A0A6N0NUE7_9CREN|nr:class I SAM-dependent methyltransferase [Metallosphaera tengchongensis]QKR00426.1 class I SAM-dependent methyltransferase [Metallosphaera tengchongensis]
MSIFDDPKGYLNWYKNHKVTYENERQAVDALDLKDCLDVGSGPSVFHEALKGEVISLDISEFVLKYIDGDRILADAHYLPFRRDAIPCVFSSVTLCFLDNLEKFFEEANRVTKRTFVSCIVTADSSWGEFYRDLGSRGHKYYSKARFLTRMEFMNLVKKFFEVERVVTTIDYGPMEEEVPEIPKEWGNGAFMCIKGIKRNDQFAYPK